MRRILWLALVLLAGLLIVTLPLASAKPAQQQQFGVGVYLPLVYQIQSPTTPHRAISSWRGFNCVLAVTQRNDDDRLHRALAR
jgi:hypothetical protein